VVKFDNKFSCYLKKYISRWKQSIGETAGLANPGLFQLYMNNTNNYILMFVVGYLQSIDNKNILLNVSSPKTIRFLEGLNDKRRKIDGVKHFSPYSNGKLKIKIERWSVIPVELLNQEVVVEVSYRKYAFKDKSDPGTAVVGYYLKFLSIKRYLG